MCKVIKAKYKIGQTVYYDTGYSKIHDFVITGIEETAENYPLYILDNGFRSIFESGLYLDKEVLKSEMIERIKAL